ncbi:NAD(P)/FAD-dependent oxidoreductase [Pseudonocardia humida]|uniref:NAD(P)/FAD-dependent oxidoreductase n=1 Tax=Pseudonocardia humida TaxID=2800819 RepID=A0ABT1A8T8_9PSEU|nr:NAD(P)/FAD-dependent oxidoreductase [Pseudonocardia humida]MCO1659408.1 NAD(P)/FAD-dependent oxidoreductase [Pseudonocardia humida]
METTQRYDVVVIGGGPAGLAGAVALARSRRSVLVVDDGTPRNAPADGVHNYLGREGTPPGELLALGRAELAGYGGAFREGRVSGAEALEGGGFRVALDGGGDVDARRLLVTTGLTDELPDVPGLAQRWGRDVLHCPYCHGWEVRERAIGVLACGPMVVHQTLLMRQLSDDVTVFRHRQPPFDDEQAEELAARGIRVVDGEVVGLEVVDDRLTGVRLASGEVVAVEALAVQPRFVARGGVAESLGLSTSDLLVGEHSIGSRVDADPTGATAVPGVYVAGNVNDPMAQVVAGAAAGMRAGSMINAELVAEETRLAVAAHRERSAARV